uniref:Putative secreted protein n=1 Tax=Anopheles marajoara TaxID=58244 RepID=A0A2M4CFZ8_9DIPT
MVTWISTIIPRSFCCIVLLIVGHAMHPPGGATCSVAELLLVLGLLSPEDVCLVEEYLTVTHCRALRLN